MLATPVTVPTSTPAADTTSHHQATPIRNWFFLNGPQVRPIEDRRLWTEYDPTVSFQLSCVHGEMEADGNDREGGLLLDLSSFTNPPSNYQVASSSFVCLSASLS